MVAVFQISESQTCESKYNDLVDKYNENRIPRYLVFAEEEKLNFTEDGQENESRTGT